MNYSAAFEISAIGMAFERLRADVASSNLANIHTTRGMQGGPYRPMRASATTAVNAGIFQQHMSQAAGELRPMKMVVQELNVAPRMVYEPGHPHADEKGYVAYPNINLVSEMTSLMTANRAYSANIAALNATKAMSLKTLDIGGNR